MSLAWRPRWLGVVGLVVGMLCVGFWVTFFVSAFVSVNNSAKALGLTVGQHAQMLMSAMVLTETAETQRTASGAPAATITLAGVPATDRFDPWGRPYRYVLMNTPRGFTFWSDGPDGITGTPDDVDLLTIQRNGVFQLPP